MPDQRPPAKAGEAKAKAVKAGLQNKKS
jgi:hypothetical protein